MAPQNSLPPDSPRLTDQELETLLDLTGINRNERLEKIKEAVKYEMDLEDKVICELEARRDELTKQAEEIDNAITEHNLVLSELEDAHRALDTCIMEEEDPQPPRGT